MKTPWVTFPEVLLIGQIDYIASPTWMAAADKDETLKSKPVGTGPFVYEDYKPNEFFKAKKNPSYWNKPYPYLDEIEFRPIPDALNRRDALKSGAVDIIHTDNGQTITEFRDNKDFPHGGDQQQRRGRLHAAPRHAGAAGRHELAAHRPAGALRARQRLRRADHHRHDRRRRRPHRQRARSPRQVGYLKDTGYPQKQDMEKAKALIADYKKENPGPLNLSLATTQDETNLTIAQFQKQWWEEAGVDNVTIDQIDQGNYIVTALLGNFQVFQWRNHSGFDLDNQYIWWHSSSAAPVGQLALNFGRIKDPQIDALLDKNRAETDPAKKQGYAEERQQDLRRAVLQPLGQLGHLGHRPQADRPRRGELHPPRRQDQPVRPGHRRHLLPDDPVDRSVIEASRLIRRRRGRRSRSWLATCSSGSSSC